MSATTIRRKIDTGEFEAERVVRPQGTAFLVKVRTDEPPRADDTPQTPHEAPDTHQDAPIGAALLAIVGPLIGQLDSQRQTIERQADQLVSQAETIGALRAENDMLRASHSTLTASTAPESPNRLWEPSPIPSPLPWPLPPHPNVGALAPWVLTLLATGLAVVLLVLLVPQ
jgi:hypothetical protein